MKALAGKVPRAFANHQTVEGYAYSAAVRAKMHTLGSLPTDARPLLREWGRITVELDLLGRRLDACRAMKKPRRLEMRRLGSESRKLRVQLLMLERRLDDVAARGTAQLDLAARTAAMHAQANGGAHG